MISIEDLHYGSPPAADLPVLSPEERERQWDSLMSIHDHDTRQGAWSGFDHVHPVHEPEFYKRGIEVSDRAVSVDGVAKVVRP